MGVEPSPTPTSHTASSIFLSAGNSCSSTFRGPGTAHSIFTWTSSLAVRSRSRVRAALGEALPWQRAGRPPAAGELTERRRAGGGPAQSRRRQRKGPPSTRPRRPGGGHASAGSGERPGRQERGGLRAMAPRAPAARRPRPPERPRAAPRSPRSRGQPGGNSELLLVLT